MNSWTWILTWLGRNPLLPRAKDVKPEEREHGMAARNSRGQKVVWDENQDRWVMPQNLTTKVNVEIK